MKLNAPGGLQRPFNSSGMMGNVRGPMMGSAPAPAAAVPPPHNRYLPAPPANLPSLAQVPTAQGGPAGYQTLDPAARARLLQAMISGAGQQPTGMFPTNTQQV